MLSAGLGAARFGAAGPGVAWRARARQGRAWHGAVMAGNPRSHSGGFAFCGAIALMLCDRMRKFLRTVSPAGQIVEWAKLPTDFRESGLFDCHTNVARFVRDFGGKAVPGHLAEKAHGCFSALHHSLWQNPQGQLVEVTPNVSHDGFRPSAFVSDPSMRIGIVCEDGVAYCAVPRPRVAKVSKPTQFWFGEIDSEGYLVLNRRHSEPFAIIPTADEGADLRQYNPIYREVGGAAE
jgi:hypothetical protein